MCIFKTPKISTPAVETTAAQLVPQTTAEDPKAPELNEDKYNKRRGKKALTINKDKTGSFKPSNM